jgi:hypothetical protein
MTADVGPQVLDQVYKQMKIDREWSVRANRQFVWWGHRLAQRVWAEPPYQDEEFTLIRMHARTDVVTGFRPTPQRLGSLAALVPRASLSGLVCDPENPGRLQLACSMYVHAETQDWVRPAFALAVAMQAAEAEMLADGLAEALGATVAASSHPASGPRPKPDDMLNILTAVVVPDGAGPSAFPGDHFNLAREMMEQSLFLASGDESGLTVEFPFGGFTSLCRIQTNQPHPWFGAGLLVRLTVPAGGSSEGEPGQMEQALALNGRELDERTRTHFLGSWCPDTHGLTFRTFFPNIWSRFCPGFAPMATLGSRLRAFWAAGVFGVAWDPEATLRRKAELFEDLTDEGLAAFLAAMRGRAGEAYQADPPATPGPSPPPAKGRKAGSEGTRKGKGGKGGRKRSE